MRATSLIAIAALVGSAITAYADDTGVAGIHTWRQVAGRTCFVDHFHDGSGSGATQKAAMIDAVKNWEGFTAFEYGSDWGSYANSVSKSASCDRSTTQFNCHLSSIPCKGGALARRMPHTQAACA